MRPEENIQLKNINRIAVLNYIHRHQPVTKTVLSEVTGLTFMTMKNVIDDLVAKGIVCAAGSQKGQRGKSVEWQINEQYGYTVGIHINIYETVIAVMDMNGMILNKSVQSGNLDFTSPIALVQQLKGLIQNILKNTELKAGNFIGIGIALPGPVDADHGVIITPPNLPSIHYLELGDILAKELRQTILLEKDTNAIAWGEYRFNSEEIAENSTMVYIDADAGIGSGIIIDGHLYHGKRFKAGEFGHMLLDPDGPRCNCGRKGCLEAIASGIAVCRDIAAQISADHPLYRRKESITINDVFEMAEEKDILSISLLNASARHMGEGIASLQQLIDADYIVLGGALTKQYTPYFEIVRNLLPDAHLIHAMPDNTAAVRGMGDLLVRRYLSGFGDMLRE